ncbi:MAG: hypothetical protein IPL92_05775 [Saprospiraceae bacterium]|nr:hypothetical protein [Candidatus Opimibacter iunctus]
METNDKFRQFIENKYPDQYRQLLRIEQANEDAMKRPKDEMTRRLEALGFRRGAVIALSDTHYFSTPSDRAGEYNLVYQRGDGVYSRYGELSISYEQGVDVWKSCGQILKEGFYTLDEFDLVLDKMERSRWYREKKDKKRLPVLSILQRSVYDALPVTFSWAQGKEIAIQAGMPSRTSQRFFGNQSLFHKVKTGTYTKKITFAEM